MSLPREGLDVRVVPGAKKDAAECAPDGGVKIRLRARAVDGKANAALTKFLADALDVPEKSVTIRMGGHSRNKVIQAAGLSPDEMRARLRVS